MRTRRGVEFYTKAWQKALQLRERVPRVLKRKNQYYVLVELTDSEHDWLHEEAEKLDTTPGAIVERAIRLHRRHWDNIGRKELTQMLCHALSQRP